MVCIQFNLNVARINLWTPLRYTANINDHQTVFHLHGLYLCRFLVRATARRLPMHKTNESRKEVLHLNRESAIILFHFMLQMSLAGFFLPSAELAGSGCWGESWRWVGLAVAYHPLPVWPLPVVLCVPLSIPLFVLSHFSICHSM